MSARVSGRRGWKGALTALLAAALMFTGAGAASAAPTTGTGSVSGTVTRAADGQPAAGVFVDVRGDNGHFVTSTDDTGAYRISNVAPGQYTVFFSDPQLELAKQWWNGAANPQSATPITVADGVDLTGIDASLDPTVSISGSVLVDGAIDMRGGSSHIAVVAEAGGEFIGMSYVHADGTYSVKVGPGTYTVRAEPTEGLAYAVAPQYYSHAASASDATPVVVSTSDTTGIDFDLSSLSADVALSVGTVQPGAAVHVTGSGFAPREPVLIELHSTPISLGMVTAGADGVVDTTVTIPADAPAGAHRIVLTGQMSTLTGGSALTVAGATTPGGSDGSGTGGTGTDPSGAGSTPAAPASASGSGTAQLAATGAEIPSAALLGGALMLLLGLAVIRVRRRA
ncbi:MAG: hypothetical protein B7X41_04520 [Microbacterium sp. 14-71-5]|uniref:carboxypeptidase-like regulatory domain-containing protein n=1 Tax=Microbacterium sp. 13-71-7 TaxID=1970399 RepID=UPI000BD573B9|nr:carboxypeptidase-like regulatory domain-containing protein [Microbacterium sp. 13-71-7]OZB83406.1 MAG: hypothetical protein B7X32_10450 [Microbacterium sp. 13-71-7]OZB89120.1 MAG: hypothetical protein B7X41_04520 [Microbacterium sp. 14-71-5]